MIYTVKRYKNSSMKYIYIIMADGYAAQKICHSNGVMKSCITPLTSTHS